MKVLDTEFNGLKVVELKVHGDSRGFFVERYNKDSYAKNGLPTEFYQDNHSRSGQYVLRGMHYQYDRPQGKLVGAIRGSILDAVVDLRWDQPTYGKSFSIELSDENGKMLWVPAGFAHGFCVLSEGLTDVVYKVDELYNPQKEAGISWNDHDFDIHWPTDKPLVSAKDEIQPSFKEYDQSDFKKSKWWVKD